MQGETNTTKSYRMFPRIPLQQGDELSLTQVILILLSNINIKKTFIYGKVKSYISRTHVTYHYIGVGDTKQVASINDFANTRFTRYHDKYAHRQRSGEKYRLNRSCMVLLLVDIRRIQYMIDRVRDLFKLTN